VLFVEHDVSEAVTERERRGRIMSQLVRTLVGVVDRRDPFSAGHSARVGMLARAIASEMGLDEQQIETAEIAGSLLNLGKIFVPAELLTRSGELTESERQQVRQGMQASAQLLEGIEFDGPVVETLRQSQAHWDGSGAPAGLAGEDILVTARVVAVANAFVGMVSRRAHREALGIDRSIQTLMGEVGRAFDRGVVAALVNYLDNRGGRAQWAESASQSAAP
jgi:HD-GYP domain-containing protein (c-di-GMP phosphodiesterase class II)